MKDGKHKGIAKRHERLKEVYHAASKKSYIFKNWLLEIISEFISVWKCKVHIQKSIVLLHINSKDLENKMSKNTIYNSIKTKNIQKFLN